MSQDDAPPSVVGSAAGGAGESSWCGPAHDVVAGLDAITQAAALVIGAGTLTLSDGELRDALAATWRVRARVEAAYLHVLAALDAREGAVPGAGPGRAGREFLVHALTSTHAAAAADVAAAHALDADTGALPVMGAALATGEVSRAHADVAVRLLRRIPAHLAAQVDEEGVSGAARIDAFLTDYAKTQSPRDVDRLAAQVLATMAPDRADRYDPDACTRRRASWVTDSTGMLVGRFQLDPASGAIVKTALESFLRRTAVQDQPADHAGHPAAPGHAGDGASADAGDHAGDGAGAGAGDDGANESGGSAGSSEQQQVLPVADERSGGQRAADALTAMAAAAMRAADRAENRAESGQGGGGVGQPATHVVIIATPEQVAAARRATPGPVDPATHTPETPPATEPRATSQHSQAGQHCEAGAHSDAGPTGPHGAAGPNSAAGAHDETNLPAEPGLPDWLGAPRGADTHASASAYPDADADAGVTGLAVCTQTGPLRPGAFARLACDAVFHLLVRDHKGAVLHLGRATRLATPAQRRALAARDRGCIAPGCATPPALCEAHHVRWWRHAGGTDLDNLALVCIRHHSAIHTGHWQLTMIDGVPWVIPPHWADPHRRPRRNTLHHDEHTARRLGQQLRLRLPADLVEPAQLPDDHPASNPDPP